jgi:hypothetical protein
MSARMKVYGWRGFKTGMPMGQARFIVAAGSVSEVLRITGMTRYQFNQDGSETGNAGETAQAMTAPGVVFYRGLNDWRDEPWQVDEP